MKDCCKHSKKDKKCIRKSDKKTFKLPRRFSKKRCKKSIRGFTMKSSCAPYKDCLKDPIVDNRNYTQRTSNHRKLRLSTTHKL